MTSVETSAPSRLGRLFRAASIVAIVAAFGVIPRSARGSDDEAKPKSSARHPKRRAKVSEIHGRERVGIGDHHLEPRSPISVGSPSQGHLENGAHLDTSKFIHVVSAYQRGDVRWGHPVLTHMIERAAKTVAKRWPGSVVDVGDLSRKNGGDLMRHHSHESGRDADVSFFVDDAKGKQIHAPHFVRFDSMLRPMNFPGAHFDEAKTWAFVQAILTDPAAHVSHIFIAEPIRQRLLAYARPRVSHVLWTRAATTMMQPTDSEAHDDHMHVRISCPSSSAGSCQEIARRIVHHPRFVAQKTPMRPSVLVTPRPPPPPSSPPLSAPAPRIEDGGDDFGPLGHTPTRPW